MSLEVGSRLGHYDVTPLRQGRNGHPGLRPRAANCRFQRRQTLLEILQRMTNSVTPRPVILLVLVLSCGILAGCAGDVVTITTPALPDGRVGEPYDFQIMADGDDAWSVVTGTLPPGISLSADGRLTGVPLLAGDFAFTVRIVDEGFLFAPSKDTDVGLLLTIQP